MAVRWLATVPDSHPLSSDSSPFLTIPAKSQASRSRPGLDVAPFSELSHRGMDGSRAMSGVVGVTSGVAPTQSEEGVVPKRKFEVCCLLPQRGNGCQTKPTASHSICPFRITSRMFQRADFDPNERQISMTFSLHIFLPFEEKGL